MYRTKNVLIENHYDEDFFGTEEHIKQKKIARKTHLKVKVKNLAEEAKIIRKEEGKARHWYVQRTLKEHRKVVVRNEARASQLAYACIKNIPYEKVEKKTNMPLWQADILFKRVTTIAKSFSIGQEKEIEEWVVKARTYIKETR